jgi:hypothetical protein
MAVVDHEFEAGRTYRIVWNESTYSGYTFGYSHNRDTRLLNNTGQVGDLITESGLALLTKERTTTTGYPFSFPAEDLAAASANVVESITLIDSTQVEADFTDNQESQWSSKRTFQKTADFKIKDDAASGTYYLLWSKQEYNPVQNQEWSFPQDITLTYDASINESVSVSGFDPYPPQRPGGYNPDKYYDPSSGWTSDPWDLTTLGGGRYKRTLIAVGHKKIYIGDI